MLSSFDIANVIGILANSAIFSYAIYYALGIRSTFSMKLYRRQALGIALIALVNLIREVNNVVLSYIPPNKPSDFLYVNEGSSGLATFFLFYPVLFYWIDYSVLAARKSDPLLRDTLCWQRARVIIRPIMFVSGAFLIGFVIYLSIFGIFSLTAATHVQPKFATLYAMVAGIPQIILLIGVPSLGIILLPISARRTKDPLLRKQLYWFGLFAVFYFTDAAQGPNGFGVFSNVFEILAAYYVLAFVFGYCLYRSAKSLVPTYSFSAEEIQTVSDHPPNA